MVLLLLALLVLSATASVSVIDQNGVVIGMYNSSDGNPFAPHDTNMIGTLEIASPLDSCHPSVQESMTPSSFVLVLNSLKCTLQDKVAAAQTAGFQAVIVFASEEEETINPLLNSSITIPIYLVTNSVGVNFINSWHASYHILLNSSFSATVSPVMITQTTVAQNSTGSGLLARNIYLGVGSYMVVTIVVLVIAYRAWKRRNQQALEQREDEQNNDDDESSIPEIVIHNSVNLPQINWNQGSEAESCCICLVEYIEGENLTLLPCSHYFHHSCVLSWLQSDHCHSCPLCRRNPTTTTATRITTAAATSSTPIAPPIATTTTAVTVEVEEILTATSTRDSYV